MPTTNEDLVERAKALAPAIQARARETEQLRRPHPDTIHELLNAGLLQMGTPRRWGGREADLNTMFKVVETISRACMSTGWVSGFYIGHNIAMAKFSLQAQEETFGRRGFALFPAVTAPNLKARRANDGWIITGRASWGTGVMDGDWVMLTGMVEGEGPRNFLLPSSDIRIVDVWNFAGMAGTGSNDILVEDVYVPTHRTLSGVEWSGGRTEGSSIHENPMYSAPFLFLAWSEVAGVFSGGLRGMADAFHDVVEKRIRNFTGTAVKDLPHAHIALGEALLDASIAADLARLQINEMADLLGSRPVNLDDRLRLKSRFGYMANHCREAANRIMSKAGASNFHLGSPVQRYFRDMNLLSTHAFWDWDVCRELTGRNALGLKPNNPLI